MSLWLPEKAQQLHRVSEWPLPALPLGLQCPGPRLTRPVQASSSPKAGPPSPRLISLGRELPDRLGAGVPSF